MSYPSVDEVWTGVWTLKHAPDLLVDSVDGCGHPARPVASTSVCHRRSINHTLPVTGSASAAISRASVISATTSSNSSRQRRALR